MRETLQCFKALNIVVNHQEAVYMLFQLIVEGLVIEHIMALLITAKVEHMSDLLCYWSIATPR